MKLWYGLNDVHDCILLGIAAIGAIFIIVQLALTAVHLFKRHRRG